MNIAASVKLYVLLIVIGGSIIFAAAGFSLYKTSAIQSIWLGFNESRSDKNRAIRALRGQMGFGGMIHHFKNYLLRENIQNKENVLLSLGGAKANLASYKLLSLNNEEKNAIKAISETLAAYEVAIENIDKNHHKGKTANEIDRLVQVDDRSAFKALTVLEQNIHGDIYIHDLTKNNNIDNSKSHLITSVRKELGYGGMIHFYKNYILRNNSSLKDKAQLKLEKTLTYIEQYANKTLTNKEAKAIDVLRQYLTTYKDRLLIIEDLIAKKFSPREIDKKVVVDDEHILNALNILERHIIFQLERRAHELEGSIDSVVFLTAIIGAMTLLIVLLMAVGSFWFVNLKIVNPITSLIKVMGGLSKGEFNVAVKATNDNTEIGDMARSVDAFKNAVKARAEFEKELKEVNANLEHRVIERTQELEDNQKRLQAIVETTVDAIIVIDDKGIINSFNASAVSMFGYDMDSVIGENINILVPQNDRGKHNKYISDYNKASEGLSIVGKGREIIAIHKSGKEFPVEITLSEIFLENKRIFTGVIRDVSERYFYEEQIRRTQKMNALGKLTGGIAHDYNNMLAIIMGYAEMLKGALSEDKKLFAYTNEIYKAGKRSSKLTNKLLDFSRHKPTKEKNVVNVNKLMHELENLLKKTLTARINLIYKFEEALWDISVDIADFENAMLNICINAMHAIEDVGKITVSTENFIVDEYLSVMLNIPEGEYIKISILDTGSGIEHHIQEHIFDPFFSTKDDKGTGLGLSQVYGFMQRSNGAIKVYSEIGYGAKFSLFLPRDVSNAEQLERNHSSSSDIESFKGNETILVVDDEPALVMLAEEILSTFGYQVLAATNGYQALVVLDKHPEVSFLLSDIIMPDMDGYELASKVKEKYPNVIIQFASGYSTPDESLKGSYEHLNIISKPYSSNTLVKRIRELLDSK